MGKLCHHSSNWLLLLCVLCPVGQQVDKGMEEPATRRWPDSGKRCFLLFWLLEEVVLLSCSTGRGTEWQADVQD